MFEERKTMAENTSGIQKQHPAMMIGLGGTG